MLLPFSGLRITESWNARSWKDNKMNDKQQGPMENLLEGLDQHAKFLSEEELKAELQARSIDVNNVLKSARTMIAEYRKAHRLAWMKVADEAKSRLAASQAVESWLA